MPIITFTTDFGTRDEYVGVMKGVALSVDPSAVVVDISHHIEAQNILQAATMLKAAHPYFPAGTVHVVVVDPGVGGGRHILAVQTLGQFFVAPDNGVLTLILDSVKGNGTTVRVENTDFFLTPVSQTFHGRDIFAPVAAHLSKGLPIGRLGPVVTVSQTVRLPVPGTRVSGTGELVGSVTAIDGFGNLVTSIDSQALDAFLAAPAQGKPCILIGRHQIDGLAASYQSVPARQTLAIVGSRGFLEIAVNRGSAAGVLAALVGDTVKLMRR